MHKLSDRMMMNVGLIPTDMRVADIGCDHGWVSIYLISQGRAKKVVAMDVASGPLERAREHVKNAGLENQIDIRLSDGAEKLIFGEDGQLEVDVVLMAGIGGHLAIRLIENSLDKMKAAKCIVIQAQSDIDYVRKRVTELGFLIEAEDMVLEDGKYYNAMRIVPVMDKLAELSEVELQYGPVLIKKQHPVLLKYIDYKKSTYMKILDGLADSGNDQEKRREEIVHELELIENCYKGITG